MLKDWDLDWQVDGFIGSETTGIRSKFNSESEFNSGGLKLACRLMYGQAVNWSKLLIKTPACEYTSFSVHTEPIERMGQYLGHLLAPAKCGYHFN